MGARGLEGELGLPGAPGPRGLPVSDTFNQYMKCIHLNHIADMLVVLEMAAPDPPVWFGIISAIISNE